ncbi:energy-coupling factor transporter transmembrane component T family protein [Gorillibacterium timonense]|uniref:energy-coupling factor transporter transmembrane component T family protein n=1 Tax=Gorillibacterium timonense TaxID=1689269 RepID=UPI00071E1528|nr:energy-coupling factor transporter transmembrane component T [Gorillibacterium timonense]
MANRMIMGKYIETGSAVHRLDPRAKTLAMLLFMAAVFLVRSTVDLAVLAAFSIGVMAATRIPFITYVRTLKPLIFLMAFIFVFHVLFDTGGSWYVDLGPVKFYSGGLQKGFMSVARMVLFVAFTAVLTLTTPPLLLTQGLESLMKPLSLFRISPRKVTLMLTTSLRFIPTVFEEANKILRAQASRGMDLVDQNVLQKAKLLISLLVPVTVGAIRRAAELVDSMEARGYRLHAPRSRFHKLTWGWGDTLLIAATALLIVITQLV